MIRILLLVCGVITLAFSESPREIEKWISKKTWDSQPWMPIELNSLSIQGQKYELPTPDDKGAFNVEVLRDYVMALHDDDLGKSSAGVRAIIKLLGKPDVIDTALLGTSWQYEAKGYLQMRSGDDPTAFVKTYGKMILRFKYGSKVGPSDYISIEFDFQPYQK